MRKQLLNTLIVSLLTAVLLLTGIMTTSVVAEETKLPDIDYLVQIARGSGGWVTPPMGGPQVRYITDHATGKSYLVEVGYWGGAQVLGEF